MISLEAWRLSSHWLHVLLTRGVLQATYPFARPTITSIAKLLLYMYSMLLYTCLFYFFLDCLFFAWLEYTAWHLHVLLYVTTICFNVILFNRHHVLSMKFILAHIICFSLSILFVCYICTHNYFDCVDKSLCIVRKSYSIC